MKRKHIIMLNRLSIAVLLCIGVGAVPRIKKEFNKVRLHSAYEALNTSLIMELDSYYHDKGRYPDSLDELTEIEYSDGATPEMLKHFGYISNGNSCKLSYYSNYYEKELVIHMAGGKIDRTKE